MAIDKPTPALGTGSIPGGSAGDALMGNPLLNMLLGSGGMGLLTGLLGIGKSPQEKMSQDLYSKISEMLPYLSSTAYSKGEVQSIADMVGRLYRGAADVSAGKAGANIGEALGASNTPQGQPSSSMYVSEVAPIVAEGEKGAAEAQKWGSEFFATLDSQSKQRLESIFGLLGQLAQGQTNMTQGQKFAGSFLQGMNIGSTGIGNIMKAYTDMTHKDIKVG